MAVKLEFCSQKGYLFRSWFELDSNKTRTNVSKKTKILKEVSVHTLRHSFATHLLEDGMDILSIKNLLGHESIDTTLIYLQIAQLSTQKLFSPLDTLFSEFGKKWEVLKPIKKQPTQPQSQPQYEVADVLNKLGDKLEDLGFNGWQLRTLFALKKCRTSALGGHIDACDECGNISISYNSCRNRHCPKCQGRNREDWIQTRETELLPVPYFTHFLLFVLIVFVIRFA